MCSIEASPGSSDDRMSPGASALHALYIHHQSVEDGALLLAERGKRFNIRHGMKLDTEAF